MYIYCLANHYDLWHFTHICPFGDWVSQRATFKTVPYNTSTFQCLWVQRIQQTRCLNTLRMTRQKSNENLQQKIFINSSRCFSCFTFSLTCQAVWCSRSVQKDQWTCTKTPIKFTKRNFASVASRPEMCERKFANPQLRHTLTEVTGREYVCKRKERVYFNVLESSKFTSTVKGRRSLGTEPDIR